MEIKEIDGCVEICGFDSFSPKHTFECGQCFRFKIQDDGSYFGVAFGKAVKIWSKGEKLYISGSKSDFNDIWRKYLDIERDYSEISRAFCGGEFLHSAIEFGKGLRILAQDEWEALCSFVVSQCNNISRIQNIIAKLCELYGEQISYEGNTCYTFPSAQKIATLSAEDLAPLRSGYRAQYIINAAQAVASGQLCFESTRKMTTEDARREVMKIHGIGRKVADCFLLFGLQKYDAFPVDTWMKKAEQHYDKDSQGANFGEYAGIAQQYIFYYARSKKI